MDKDDFFWLRHWFKNQCDGDWEHQNGIHITTLNKPGWFIRINLESTELENKAFEEMKKDLSENDWFTCFVESNKFKGFCGPLNLPEVLRIFRQWAEKENNL